MNILPKKRWHVRTKENIARVKADEAKYAEEVGQKNFKAILAEQESRTELLRRRAHVTEVTKQTSSNTDLRLFSKSDVHLIEGNKDYAAELRSEKEKQEKSIGLLTYLGQSLLEAGGEKPWYEVHPSKRVKPELEKTDASKIKEEWEAKKKSRADPLTTMNRVSEWFEHKHGQKASEETKLLQRASSCIAAMPSLFPNDIAVPKSSSVKRGLDTLTAPTQDQVTKHMRGKHKREGSRRKRRKRDHAGSSSDSDSEYDQRSTDAAVTSKPASPPPRQTSSAIDLVKQANLDRMRAERLQRERKERERAAVILAKATGLPEVMSVKPDRDAAPPDERNLPFNSAFNPELSKVLAERRQRHKQSRKWQLPP